MPTLTTGPIETWPSALDRVEQRQRAYLHRRIARIRKMLAPVLREIPAAIDSARVRQDEEDEEYTGLTFALGPILHRIRQIRQAWEETAPSGVVEMSEIIRAADKAITPTANRAIKAQITMIDVVSTGPAAEAYPRFVAENVSLIKSLDAGVFGQIESLVAEAMVTGQRVEQLADAIEDRFGVARSRANLIARDQMGKANGAITMIRQQSVGIRSYRWIDSSDQRVRPTHRANDQEVFRWDDPPPITGHPGEDYQCRCIARPVLEEDDPEAVAAVEIHQNRLRRQKNEGRRLYTAPTSEFTDTMDRLVGNPFGGVA